MPGAPLLCLFRCCFSFHPRHGLSGQVGQLRHRKAKGLKIFVLEGANAVNFIPDGTGQTIVVEVRDENDLPLEGADVRFELPESGPGGFFAGGEHVRSVKTTLQGQAGAPFSINPVPGKFRVTVKATLGTRGAETTVLQENSLKPIESLSSRAKSSRHHWYTNWKVLAVVAAAKDGIAVGVVLATRGGGKSTPTVVIKPGSPTFGGPQ